MMLATGEGLVVYPVVVVKVEGIMCRALLDTGAAYSRRRPRRRGFRFEEESEIPASLQRCSVESLDRGVSQVFERAAQFKAQNQRDMTVQLGDVVLIQSPERNRGKWNIGIVNKLIKGKDGVVTAIRLRAGKSYLDRAIQHLYPMELSCDH
ncbi:hypothetical protein ACROYT_G027433 [Oculina patagonica]